MPADSSVTFDSHDRVDVRAAIYDLAGGGHLGRQLVICDDVLRRIVGGQVERVKLSTAPIKVTIAALSILRSLTACSMVSSSSPSRTSITFGAHHTKLTAEVPDAVALRRTQPRRLGQRVGDDDDSPPREAKVRSYL
jgi:hypothetical protein